jgi:hypothetical protein
MIRLTSNIDLSEMDLNKHEKRLKRKRTASSVIHNSAIAPPRWDRLIDNAACSLAGAAPEIEDEERKMPALRAPTKTDAPPTYRKYRVGGVPPPCRLISDTS